MSDDDAELARRVAACLRAEAGLDVEVGAIRRFPVGFSWLTFGVELRGLPPPDAAAPPRRVVPADAKAREAANGSTEVILRLGPADGLFAPYSAAPQLLALRSLEGSAVPIPRAFWGGDDERWFGMPWLFCEKVDGEAVVPWVPKDTPGLPDAERGSLAADFVDALAALHRVDWRELPIAALDGCAPGEAPPLGPGAARGESPPLGAGRARGEAVTADNAARLAVEQCEAQIERWAMRPFPLAAWGARWLKRHAPAAPRVSIVHGDYRTGNFLERGGRITAILDWELVHLGDPHEDLGWVSLPMYRGGTALIGRLAEPAWFFARYAERAGFVPDPASIRWWQIFSFLKLAATHMAAARCFEEGRLDDMRMPAMGSQVATCLREMDKAIAAAEAA